MKRSLWLEELSDESCPAWPCPTCQKGTVALVPGSLEYHETVESARSHGHEDFEPEWIEYVFVAWGRCTHPSCEQYFAISGNGGVSAYYDEGQVWADNFSPLSVSPMPDMIELPSKCPKQVSREVRAAFALFWSNPGACANALRIALERLMDSVGIPAQVPDKNSELRDLNLHARIDLYVKKDPVVGPQLMALKWLGNTGSHSGNVNQHELLDAFEVLENALAEVIEKRSARVAQLAEDLSRRHNPAES